jgi:phosphate transport system substrate-binding protein
MNQSSSTLLTSALAAAAIGALAANAQAAERIAIDGSSTVYPITEAVAEEFQKAHGDTQVTVGVSGTGGGFEQFCAGRTDISAASRPIEAQERQLCEENDIEYIELPVALDAITVVVNPKNKWAQCMTVDELKTMWEPAAQSKVTSWSDVRSQWPDQELSLYGPGADSGTFDYFTKAVVGEEGMIRGDFTPSEDDNVLVQGVSRNPYALAYFGYAYYSENKDILNAVAIDGGDGCVKPSFASAKSGAYQPLSRPLFIYVSQQSAEEDHVQGFVESYLDPQQAPQLIQSVGYVPLPGQAYEMAMQDFEDRELGTAFASGAQTGTSIEALMKMKKVN